jgi:hypothetical protein
MTTIQKIFLLFFILFLAAIPAWRLLIAPELLKLPGDYERKFDLFYLSNEDYDLENGFSGESIINAVSEDKTIGVNGGNQVIESYYKAETLAGELAWETRNKFGINRETRENITRNEKGAVGSYFVFPQKVEKRSYKIWPLGYNHSFDVQFDGVENVEGLEVYHFSFANEIRDDTKDFTWIELVPDTYGANSMQSSEFLVEPATGILVNFDDGGTSYYVDKTTGEKIQDFLTWKAKFTDDTIANQVRLAQNKKQEIILYERWIPVLLGLISLAFLVALFASRKVMVSPNHLNKQSQTKS